MQTKQQIIKLWYKLLLSLWVTVMDCHMNIKKLALLSLLSFVGGVAAMPDVAAKKSVKLELQATDHILQGAVVAPDKADMEPVVVMFRGERASVDKNGFFSFVKKNHQEAFEPIPFKKKMTQAIDARDTGEEVPAVSVSPLITPGIKADKYYLLITQSFQHVVEGLNDVSGFRQIAGAPHLFFSFIAQNSTRPNGEIVIKPTSLEKRNYLYAPDKTIVVLMNPNRVKKLEYWPFELGSQFIQLPRIVLLSEQEILERKLEKDPTRADLLSPSANNLGRQAVKSNFLSLEMRPFFEEQDKVVVWKKQRKDQPVKVEMVVY